MSVIEHKGNRCDTKINGLRYWKLGFGRCRRQLESWSERRRQRLALCRLDDRALRDIGLSRADVEAETRKPFWKP